MPEPIIRLSGAKTERFEEGRLAAIIGMRSIKQIIRDLIALHNGLVGIG